MARQEALGEDHHVVATPAQRRDLHPGAAEPVVEIGAEALVGDVLLEIAVRRGDDADVDAARASFERGRTLAGALVEACPDRTEGRELDEALREAAAALGPERTLVGVVGAQDSEAAQRAADEAEDARAKGDGAQGVVEEEVVDERG